MASLCTGEDLKLVMSTVCTGCGEDLAERQSGRRALNGPGAVKVVQVWRELLLKLGRAEREGELLEAGDKIYMCRKCFSSYERYSKLGVDIEGKLLNTLDTSSNSSQKRPAPGLIPGTPKPKRVRHQDRSTRTHHHYSPGHCGSSPSVAVGSFFIMSNREVSTVLKSTGSGGIQITQEVYSDTTSQNAWESCGKRFSFFHS